MMNDSLIFIRLQKKNNIYHLKIFFNNSSHFELKIMINIAKYIYYLIKCIL